jgi:prepilin-type processing-associated H-X9-DG protein
MNDQGPNHTRPAPIPVNRRFRGRRYALPLLIGIAGLVGATLAYRELASRMAESSCKSNLERLGLALHAYHDLHGSFPPAFVKGKDGTPAHSWRVLILPFLGRQDLFDSYHFDEPWDGPNNIRLAGQMPDVFACPGGPGRGTGKTSYVAVVGSQTVWPGDRAATRQDLVRPSSHTVQFIEIADSDIGWTEPRDVSMDDIIPPDGDGVGARFASGHKGAVNVLLCDGSARTLKKSSGGRDSRRLLYTLLTAWGGHPYKGVWLPGENPTLRAADFPAEEDASTLRAADVLPHTAGPIHAGRNYVYCATFQVAWDDFRQLVGGDPLVEGRPSIGAGLNRQVFPRSALSPAAYMARMGRGEHAREKIVAEMAKKFPGVTPSLRDAAGPDEFIGYAFLQKDLPFAARFDRVSKPLTFHAATGDAKVMSFGFEELASALSETSALKEQVDVLHYQSDEEFVLRLKPKVDEIVLAKIRPKATLGETVRAVQKMIGAGPENGSRPGLQANDTLLIPRLGFNVLRRYDELVGKHLENPGKATWRIVEAKQAVRFLLNESGARLESEAVLLGELDGHTPPPAPPRMFVFDRPFLLYLKERTAAQPYLVIWVANAELMKRHE